MAGIDERIIDDNAKYFDGTTIPQNTTTSSSAVQTGEGGQEGATKILCRAGGTAIGIAGATTMTINVQDSADGTTGWTTIGDDVTSGAATIAAGTEFFEFVLPRTVREYTRVQVVTTDAAATGTIDVFCSSAVGVGKL